MSESDTGKRAVRRWRDIIAVFILSATAVLTAWSGFEASKWGGEESIAYSQASAARIQSAGFDSAARDARQLDLTVYSQWVVATAAGNTQLADYIQARFTPQFAVAFNAWVADGMTENGPFTRPEYVPDGTVQAAQLSAAADDKFSLALVSNQRGDNYSLLTVLFALVLFLAAMAQREAPLWVSRILLGVAGAALVAGLIIMITFPINL